MKKKLIIIFSSIIAFILLLVGVFYIYVGDYYHATEDADNYLESTEYVEVVDNKNMYTFIPNNADTGIIFYPGGKVEAKSYAPLMMELASDYGYLCVLIEMPFNLAVLDMNAADGIIDNYSNIDSWYMAGHSLGGSMAASYLANNLDDFDGLILLGAYSTEDFSDKDIDVISIYGENDGVMNKDKYNKYLSNMPVSFYEEIVIGGNHAYFGMYKEQAGDGKASISCLEQINITSNLINKYLD